MAEPPFASDSTALGPEVDVVIPVRNGLPYVLDAVTSAAGQLGVSTQVVVVDDGSEDGSAAAVRGLGLENVTVLSGHAHVSTCAARNRGVRFSSSSWLSFLDADDWWPPERTRILIDAISDPVVDIALGHIEQFGGTAVPAHEALPLDAGSPLAACAGGTLTSRNLFERVGFFDETLRVAEYVDWLARARAAGCREIVVPTVSLYRRLHEHNTSTERADDYRRDVMTVVARHRRSTLDAAHDNPRISRDP